MKEASQRLSEILAELDAGREMSVGELLDAFATRTFGAAIFLFAAPNLVPNPPGTSPILGVPLLLLSCQLLFGRKTIWLPERLRSRHVPREVTGAMVRRLGPFMRRLEDVLAPRWDVLVRSDLSRRAIGLVSLPLAVILLLPLPFLHMLPGAAMACFGIGLAERDGLAVLAGHVLALVTLVMTAVLGLYAHAGLVSLLGWGGGG